MKNRIIVIDGNSLINRAYYAIQRPMITKEGLYTHAVYGFLNMLNKINTDYESGYMVVAFDRKAPTFRHIEYADYKAGRKKMPPELAMQMPLLKEVLGAMRIKMLEIDGFEADDIIGTVAKQAEREGLEPLIITGDKDELQLASDKTKVIITKKGITDFEIYDETAMREKYEFSPLEFIDYKGLMGDQSDNIPGIPGVGEKTAQKLIKQFGSIENMLNNLDEISNAKLRQKVEDNAQLAMMSKRLATIFTEVPIEINFDEFSLDEPDYDSLIEMYRKLEFNSFLKKLQGKGNNLESGMLRPTISGTSSNGALTSEAAVSELISENVPAVTFSETEGMKVETVVICDESGIEDLKVSLEQNSSVVIKVFSDHNHKGKPVVYGISILSSNRCFYVDLSQTDRVEQLKSLLAEQKIVVCGHRLQDDYFSLFSNGFTPLTSGFDTAIAQYLLEPSRSNYDLKTLMLEYFHEEFPDEDRFLADNGQIDFLEGPDLQYAEYGTMWCTSVARLSQLLRAKLLENELEEVFYQVELPLIEVLADMEKEGFAVDRQELLNAGSRITQQFSVVAARIYELAGEEFNINSPIQLGSILFEKLGLPVGKKTKRGYSTGAEVLERLMDQHEIIPLIVEYRMLTKLNSTYIEGLLPLIDKTGKIHAHFQQTVTATGRISCTEPNLQNIPIRQELGRTLRKAFVPESEDYILIGADYSQIELRVLAHMSEDPVLLESFNEGQDIHRVTASRVFGVPEELVSSQMRSNAKAVNFGVIYGISSFGLSTGLHITRKEAESYIAEYFNKHERVKAFMDGLVVQCKEHGYVTTIMNRRRSIPEIKASNYMVRQLGERLAMNSPIQGSAADIIKLAMIKVYEQLKKEGTKSRLILQVHDELIVQTHKDELEHVKKLLVDNMEKAVELKVKLVADLNTGINWYELK